MRPSRRRRRQIGGATLAAAAWLIGRLLLPDPVGSPANNTS